MIYTLTDTEDTIQPVTPEDDAIYCTIGKEYADKARRLLGRMRSIMSGNEMRQCEAAASEYDEFDTDVIDRLWNQFGYQLP